MNKNILDKIKKLMALGQSPNPNEAAAAMRKAHQLMMEHSLTLSDIEMSKVEERGTHYMRSANIQGYEAILSQVIQERFGVQRIFIRDHRGSKCTFVGLRHMAEIASYVFDVLYRKLVAARTAYLATLSKRMKRVNKIRMADEYARGWALAVYRAIEKLVPMTEQPAIVEDYMMANHPDLVSKEVKERRAKGQRGSIAAMLGYIDGQKVEINAGVGARPHKQLS